MQFVCVCQKEKAHVALVRHKFNIDTNTNRPCAFVLHRSHASCHWVSSCQTCCVSQQISDTFLSLIYILGCLSIYPVFLTNPNTTQDPYRISYAGLHPHCLVCPGNRIFTQRRADQLTTEPEQKGLELYLNKTVQKCRFLFYILIISFKVNITGPKSPVGVFKNTTNN